MKITNAHIYKKLDQIQKALNRIQEEESEVLKEETKIVMEETQLLKLLDKNVDLQFESIIDWKNFIWDSCPYKKPIEKSKEIDFYCKKTGNKCRFADCFRNKKKSLKPKK